MIADQRSLKDPNNEKTKRLEKRNSRGHLMVWEVEFIIDQWHSRSSNYGALTRIAKHLGTTTVTVSNVILRETGKRPTFHPLTVEN
ncbi:MAG: hypothetical protein AAFY99_14440 [Pseudomonadota bacterium]